MLYPKPYFNEQCYKKVSVYLDKVWYPGSWISPEMVMYSQLIQEKIFKFSPDIIHDQSSWECWDMIVIEG